PAVGHPEGDVIQGLGPHAASVPTTCLSTACANRPHAVAAACSSGSDRARSDASLRCRAAPSYDLSAAWFRSGGRRDDPTTCRASRFATLGPLSHRTSPAPC